MLKYEKLNINIILQGLREETRNFIEGILKSSEDIDKDVYQPPIDQPKSEKPCIKVVKDNDTSSPISDNTFDNKDIKDPIHSSKCQSNFIIIPLSITFGLCYYLYAKNACKNVKIEDPKIINSFTNLIKPKPKLSIYSNCLIITISAIAVLYKLKHIFVNQEKELM